MSQARGIIQAGRPLSLYPSMEELARLEPKPLVRARPTLEDITAMPVNMFTARRMKAIPDEVIDTVCGLLLSNKPKTVRAAIEEHMIVTDEEWALILTHPRVKEARFRRRDIMHDDVRDYIAETRMGHIEAVEELAEAFAEEDPKLAFEARKYLIGDLGALTANGGAPQAQSVTVNVNTSATANANEPSWKDKIKATNVADFDGGDTVVRIG